MASRLYTVHLFLIVVVLLAVGGAVWWYGGVSAGYVTGVVISFEQDGSQWPFDTTTLASTSAADSGAEGNTLTLHNAPTPTFGRIGQGLRFNGSTQYGSAGDIGSVRGVALWIKPDSITAQGILQFSGSSCISMNGSGTITTTGISGATIYVDGEASATIPDTDWHHVVVTSSGDITASAFEIARANGDYFDGVMDDVRTSVGGYASGDVVRLYSLGM